MVINMEIVEYSSAILMNFCSQDSIEYIGARKTYLGPVQPVLVPNLPLNAKNTYLV